MTAGLLAGILNGHAKKKKKKKQGCPPLTVQVFRKQRKCLFEIRILMFHWMSCLAWVQQVVSDEDVGGQQDFGCCLIIKAVQMCVTCTEHTAAFYRSL